MVSWLFRQIFYTLWEYKKQTMHETKWFNQETKTMIENLKWLKWKIFSTRKGKYFYFEKKKKKKTYAK